MTAHVRHERKTRERYGRVGDGAALPDHLGVGWCDEICEGFFYMSADHALLALETGTGIAPCRACLYAMRAVLHHELLGRHDIGTTGAALVHRVAGALVNAFPENTPTRDAVTAVAINLIYMADAGHLDRAYVLRTVQTAIQEMKPAKGPAS